MTMEDIQILQSSIVLKKIIEAKSILLSIRKDFEKIYAPEVVPNVPSLNFKLQNITSGLIESSMWLTHMLTILENKTQEIKIIKFDIEHLNSKEKLCFYLNQLEKLITDKNLIGVLFHKNIKSLEIANTTFYIKLCDTKHWINYLMNNE